jgi:ketosteroid isomerase-like protein
VSCGGNQEAHGFNQVAVMGSVLAVRSLFQEMAMSTILALLISVVLASVSATQIVAQSPVRAGSEVAATAADAAAVRSLEEQERTAVLNLDFAALERIWSEHFIVNAPMNVIAPNRAVVLDIFRQGLAHYSSFERRIENLRLDGGFAVVMGSETVRPIGKAPLAGQTVERRFTHLWKKEGGAWRLVARHANNIPPSP